MARRSSKKSETKLSPAAAKKGRRPVTSAPFPTTEGRKEGGREGRREGGREGSAAAQPVYNVSSFPRNCAEDPSFPRTQASAIHSFTLHLYIHQISPDGTKPIRNFFRT